MRRIVVLTGAIAIAIALALVAAPPATSASPSACRVVTAADAGKALGMVVPAGTPVTSSAYTGCVYSSSNGRNVAVQLRPLSRAAFAKLARITLSRYLHVTGIGGDAYAVRGQLLIWKHGVLLTLLITGIGNPLAAEEALGKTAAARL